MGNLIILILTIAYYIVIVAIVIKILLENRKPIYSASLITMIVAIPIVGLILFFFVGYKMNKSEFVSKKWHKDRREIEKWKTTMYDKISQKQQHEIHDPSKEWNKIIKMLYINDNAALTYYNDVELLINGENTFPQIIEDLKNAKHHIHIEYYIFEQDEVGNEILNILFQKAKEGVKIRFIIDSFGSRAINKKTFKLLKDNDIEVYSFLPLFTPKLFRYVNIRDHRKLILIDGRIAYTGGINISKRYSNLEEYNNKRYWRDTHIKITGDAVKSFELQFFNIWKFVSKQKEDFFNEIFTCTEQITTNRVVTQLVDSGPDSEYQSVLNFLQIAITNAQKEILIQTPYFLPPEELYSALVTSALSGIKIKIMIPKVCDYKMVTYASRSYLERLANIGVEFYFYTKGFLHSKVFIFDDTLSSVGSTNFDFRSFFANYELNAIFYSNKMNSKFKEMFEQDLLDCEKLIPSEWKKRPFPQKFAESFFRLFAPLL
ncbi:MAG: cardiolipin synthase [Bacteroidales bacterium]